MRRKLAIGGTAVLIGVLMATNPVVVEAAGQITGRQIKNNSVASKDVKNNSLKGGDVKDDSLTGADVAEGTLAKVPTAGKADTATSAGTADALAVAPSGYTQSGIFSAAASNDTASNDGYLGFAINYARPLATPIPNDNIIDTGFAADPAHCPGPGQAAKGYLCLYPNTYNGVDEGYGYSEDPDVLVGGRSIGVVGYFSVISDDPYAGGVWTATAP